MKFLACLFPLPIFLVSKSHFVGQIDVGTIILIIPDKVKLKDNFEMLAFMYLVESKQPCSWVNFRTRVH